VVGNLQSLRYGNGVTNLYQYDSRNRLTNLVWNYGGTPLASFAYTLGPTGNRTNLSETVNGTSHTYGWTYDYLYRLTSEGIGNMGTVNYNYDAVGNRTSRTSSLTGLGNQTFIFNPNDWQTNTDGYDNNGNTTSSGVNTYQYDVFNRLTNVNNGQIVIAYDGDGNRVSKTIGGVTTYYLVDDRNPSGYAQVVEEYQGTTPSRVYCYGLDLISQRQATSSAVSYYGYDGHGSTRFLANIVGGITDTYAYDAYGNLIANTGTTPNNYLYCGQQYDSDLGFYYNRARYLNTSTGRFGTMDSYEGNNEDPLSLHKYLYAADSPLDNTDPSGLTLYKCLIDASASGSSLPFDLYMIGGQHAYIYDDTTEEIYELDGSIWHCGGTIKKVEPNFRYRLPGQAGVRWAEVPFSNGHELGVRLAVGLYPFNNQAWVPFQNDCHTFCFFILTVNMLPDPEPLSFGGGRINWHEFKDRLVIPMIDNVIHDIETFGGVLASE